MAYDIEIPSRYHVWCYFKTSWNWVSRNYKISEGAFMAYGVLKKLCSLPSSWSLIILPNQDSSLTRDTSSHNSNVPLHEGTHRAATGLGGLLYMFWTVIIDNKLLIHVQRPWKLNQVFSPAKLKRWLRLEAWRKRKSSWWIIYFLSYCWWPH